MENRKLSIRRHLVQRRRVSHALQREDLSGDVRSVSDYATENATVRVTTQER